MDWHIDIPQKVVIIGGMAAGCKAASRLARILPDCKITIIEKGEIIAFGKCGMPLFASGEINELMDLAKTPWGVVQEPKFFQQAKGVKVLNNTEAIEIDHHKKTVVCRNLLNDENISLSYDAILLATGTKAKIPPFSCPQSDRIRTFYQPEDANHFRKLANSGKVGSAIILGGGYIGVELAEAMVSLWGIETTLIEVENSLMARQLNREISKVLVSELKKNDISVRLNATIKSIEETNSENVTVTLNDGKTLNSDFLFICLGIEPETSLAQALDIQVGSYNGIVVDEQMKTSVPGIWAAGDCVEVKNLISKRSEWFALGSLSNRQGKVAADSIAHRKATFPGSVGTTSLKVFDLNIATAGLHEAAAKSLEMDFRAVWGTFPDRPHYHPDKQNLFAKIIYQPKSLKIVGIQMIGEGQVFRYIDVVSVLLPKDLTAYDLMELEHAYMPAHSSPMTPLNHLGAMILAQEHDDINAVSPNVSQLKDDLFLDVRLQSEIEEASLPGNVLKIPQDELRDRISEIDLDRKIHAVCKQGPRAYQAVCYLKERGADNIDYVGGGSSLLLIKQDDE